MPITARNICVTGSQGRVILDNVHVTVPDGSVTLIVGRNGAGKSTLLDALSGLVNLQSGEVHYDGIPLWNGKRLNKEAMYLIGNVFQYPEQQLFAQTVEGEFAFSLKYLRLPAEEIAARSLLALRQAALPEDWLTVSPHQLSGGQKRRVALATTMSTDPRWLLLDEPTAGLDAEGTNTRLSWLHRCKQEGRGMVIVTHDLETLLPLADQVIVLQNGRVFAQIAGEDIGRSGNILREAGLGVPFTLQMAELLTTRGEELAAGYPDAARLAEAVERLTLIKGRNQVDPHPRSKTESDQSNFMPEKGPANEFEPEVAAAMEASGGLAAIDPRAKWLVCMLLSLGILLQINWLGLLISALMAAAVVGSVRGAWRILLRLSLPFTFFIVISMIVSGAEFAGGVHFAAASSMRTLFE